MTILGLVWLAPPTATFSTRTMCVVWSRVAAKMRHLLHVSYIVDLMKEANVTNLVDQYFLSTRVARKSHPIAGKPGNEVEAVTATSRSFNDSISRY